VLVPVDGLKIVGDQRSQRRGLARTLARAVVPAVGGALIEESGAEYVPAASRELGSFDLVVECAGNAQLMADALGLVRRSGIVCLLGIDGREQTVGLDGRTIGVDAVLENRVLFGSVNARREDWLAGIDALDEMRRRWPGTLDQLIGLRVPLDRFEEALAFGGGKATLVLDDV